MLLRILAGIGGVVLLGLGCLGQLQAIQDYPDIRRWITTGGTILVSVGSISGDWNARMFAAFVCFLPLTFIFGGFALCRWAIRIE